MTIPTASRHSSFDQSGVSGALICGLGMKPCADGVIVFLDAGRGGVH